MAKDKFTAVWLSHSSIGDYLKCPRSYYLRHVYKDPKSKKKITITSPNLSLGQAVHEVVESLSGQPSPDRLKIPLDRKLEEVWDKISGERGGFRDLDQEREFKERGKQMLQRITQNPEPLLQKAIKIRDPLPSFWFSEEDNIILCGKIDWLQYFEETDSVGILDFKTGKYDEDPDSLQLPIYLLLATKCQSRPVSQASYWYLDRDNEPVIQNLPDIESANARLLPIAKKISLARKLNHFQCHKQDGCRACDPYELIISGKGKLVASEGYQDIYIV